MVLPLVSTSVAPNTHHHATPSAAQMMLIERSLAIYTFRRRWRVYRGAASHRRGASHHGLRVPPKGAHSALWWWREYHCYPTRSASGGRLRGNTPRGWCSSWGVGTCGCWFIWYLCAMGWCFKVSDNLQMYTMGVSKIWSAVGMCNVYIWKTKVINQNHKHDCSI